MWAVRGKGWPLHSEFDNEKIALVAWSDGPPSLRRTGVSGFCNPAHRFYTYVPMVRYELMAGMAWGRAPTLATLNTRWGGFLGLQFLRPGQAVEVTGLKVKVPGYHKVRR